MIFKKKVFRKSSDTVPSLIHLLFIHRELKKSLFVCKTNEINLFFNLYSNIKNFACFARVYNLKNYKHLAYVQENFYGV